MLLDKFRNAKITEIKHLEQLQRLRSLPPVWNGNRPSFSSKLRPVGGLPAIIAEYKRASPSKGKICENVDVSEASLAYAENGASALSILTEELYFKGHLSFIRKAQETLSSQGYNLPLLRKDFVMDPLQIRITASTPASAVLLIVRLTPDPFLLRDLRLQAESYGMDAVVEVFGEEDLGIARASGAQIVQVNARDLETLQVNTDAVLELAHKKPPQDNELWIAASGISKGAQLLDTVKAGYSAVLVGTALMNEGTPGLTLHKLIDYAQRPTCEHTKNNGQ